MARLLKIFRVIRNHPKKSLLLGGLVAIGGRAAKDKYEEEQMMQKYCEEASWHGGLPQPITVKERHVTVLLNPASCNGKGKAKFEKYCAPLLSLAGLKVAVVKTEYEGQARELMGVMDNTDAVIVAGGDGTFSEVLTGLLRRPDYKTASKLFPLGLLPLGITNETAGTIWEFGNSPDPRHLCEATMAIIKDVKRPLDVIKITPLQGSDISEPPKSVYASAEIEWGAARDAEERMQAYWYWAFLKKYMTFIFSSYKDISLNCSIDVEYTLPCSGCSHCKSTEQESSAASQLTVNRRWWQFFLPVSKYYTSNIKEKMDEVDYDRIENEDCGKIYRKNVKNTSEMRISSRNAKETSHLPSHALSLKTGTEEIGTFKFMTEGWRRVWTRCKSHSFEVLFREASVQPVNGSSLNKEGKQREMYIDNENFEVRPMHISIMPEAAVIFAPNSDH